MVGEVVIDADGEVVFGGIFLEFVEDGLGHGRGELFGGQTITAADDLGLSGADDGFPGFGHGGDDVEVEGLAEGSGFLGAVEDGDGFGRLGERGQEILGVERTIEVDGEDADLFAFGIEGVAGLVHGADGGTHEDDDAIGVRGAVVFKEVILAAGLFGEAIHGFLDDAGNGVVVGIACFASLEEDVRVLSGAADGGVFGRQAAIVVGLDEVLIDEGARVVKAEEVDAVDFVGCAEAVKEVKEGHAGFERRHLRDHGEVLGFLNGGRGEHGKTGGACVHDVAVVAKDGQRVAGQTSRRDVENGRGQFAGDFEHVGDFEQQPL